MIDPISEIFLDQIRKAAHREDQKMRKLDYWMLCPSCGRRVVNKELTKKGCYLCGWKGTAQEIKTENTQSYRLKCPKCGRQVIKEELDERGCFICSWKPRPGN